MKKFSILIILLLFLWSCSYIFCGHTGSIDFINTGSSTIYVRHVEGFDSEPPVGYLIPNATKGSRMSCNNVPREVRIVWFYEEDANTSKKSIFFSVSEDHIKESIIDMKPISKFRITSDINFIFDKNAQWSVSLSD